MKGYQKNFESHVYLGILRRFFDYRRVYHNNNGYLNELR